MIKLGAKKKKGKKKAKKTIYMNNFVKDTDSTNQI
jgi:hypothetical protein